MRDPYLYEDSDVLKNKLDIKTQDELNDAEADYVRDRAEKKLLMKLQKAEAVKDGEGWLSLAEVKSLVSKNKE